MFLFGISVCALAGVATPRAHSVSRWGSGTFERKQSLQGKRHAAPPARAQLFGVEVSSSGSVLVAVERLFEIFSRFEAHNFLRRDGNGLACFGMFELAGLLVFDLEDAKVAQLQALILNEGLGHEV